MAMHSYANMGYLLPLNKETLEKFDMIEESVLTGLINLIEDRDDGFDPEAAEWSLFIGAFEAEFGLVPDSVYLDDECDGFAGEAESGYFMYFGEDDKYNRIIRTEWTELPVEPKASRWTSFG